MVHLPSGRLKTSNSVVDHGWVYRRAQPRGQFCSVFAHTQSQQETNNSESLVCLKASREGQFCSIFICKFDSDVPQGGALGPILLRFCVNPIQVSIASCVRHFAQTKTAPDAHVSAAITTLGVSKSLATHCRDSRRVKSISGDLVICCCRCKH